MKITAIILLFLTILSITFYIATLPNSYEECVLKTMDGRDVKLIVFARTICRKEFPEVIIDPWAVDKD